MLAHFNHVHAAHCESGACAALLRHHGLELSEPMVFGIGSGLFFLYLPLVKIYGVPLTAYRDMPNAILARCTRRLGVSLRKARYRDPERGMRALDEMLSRDVPVGLQTGVFWLPYFPRDMRFQFNGHHVVAIGKEGGEYLLSDTVFEDIVRCPGEDLRRARFSKGPLAPKGLLYYFDGLRSTPNLARAARAGLRTTAWRMLKIPLPYMGVAGIRTLARSMREWPGRLGEAQAKRWLAGVIRMQEEIGTGGGGFRFMYAAFLDEAAELLGEPKLHEASRMLSVVGDAWREFAVQGAKVLRGQGADERGYPGLADIVLDCADREAKVFRLVRATV